jgi:hypothetical protein
VENQPVEAPHGGVHGGAITVYQESESMFSSERRRYVCITSACLYSC